jgi:nucleoid-associated protein YgaU
MEDGETTPSEPIREGPEPVREGPEPNREGPEPVAPATSAEPEPEPTPLGEAAAEPDEPVAPVPAEEPVRRNRTWVWAALVLIGAAIIGLVIGGTLGGRQGGPLTTQAGGNGRPTIVVGSAVASPSVQAGSPGPSPSASVAGATAVSSTGASQYVVQPGDTLRSIADQEYGDAALWPRIYQANRDVIGADPDNLVAGTTLQIPPP